MNLSDLMDTVRNALGLGGAKPAPPAARPAPATPTPAPTAAAPAPPPRPTPAPGPPRPAPVAAAPAPAPTGTATLTRPVRAGGHVLAAGTPVKIVATHGKGNAYTVQLPGLANAKTIEGAAIRVG